MAVTIKDIAAKAQVSRATVDRVLHNRGNVNDQVKTKILKAIKDLGYEPNHYAAVLAKSKKVIKIGIIISSVNHQFFTRIKSGIQEVINQRSQHFEYIILENRYNILQQQLTHIKQIAQLNVDGLIITPIKDDLIMEALNDLTIPVVLLTQDLNINNRLTYVGCDYHSNGVIAADLVNHLINGQQLLIVSGPQSMDAYYQRLKGFLSNLDVSIKHHVIEIDNTNEDIIKKYAEYIKDQKPNLIYYMASGIKGLLSEYFKVKDQIKIVAIDESLDVIKALNSDIISVTVTQQPEKQGYKALEYLTNHLLLKTPIEPINYIGNKIKVKHSNFNEKIKEGEN